MGIECCKRKPHFVTQWKDAQIKDNCFNLYLCMECGSIIKEDVWYNEGIFKIDQDNNTSFITKDKEYKVKVEIFEKEIK